MAAKYQECLNSLQCAGNMDCYFNVTHDEYMKPIPLSSPLASPIGFCTCQAHYAWTGENCTEISSANYVMASIVSIQITFGIIFGILCARLLYHCFVMNKH